jgi:hypothetical protein
MKISIPVLFLLMISADLFSLEVKNQDLVYDENIHTVLFHRRGDQMTNPVVRLGSDDQLKLSFDDLSSETYLFKFTVIHCDHEWNTTNLQQFEYIDGFEEDEIRRFEYSFNAIPGYIHYEAFFPNQNMNVRLSGNYILKVYLNDPSDENVILTRRFFVIEPMTNINVTIPYYPRVLEYTRLKQQIDLFINTPDIFMAEPSRRVNVNIQQNGRWDNAKIGLKPTGTTTNMLDYNYQNGIVFDGGNEYRNFNIESYWYRSMYVREIINEADGFSVILHTMGSRANKPYETLVDLNGRRVIQARQEQNTHTEGEYAWVHFSLKSPKIQKANVYILGQLNDWQLNEKSLMTYNSSMGQYQGKLYLKQGFYDYAYVVVPDGKTKGDITFFEGDHWQAANEYTVYVYYRERVPEYDRLVGYRAFKSRDVSR